MGNRLPSEIKNYFEATDLLSRNISVIAFREDGVALFANQDNGQAKGALMGGAWQAAKALINLTSENKIPEIDQRFTFSDSSSGIYILPFEHETQMYFVGYVYENIINPGQLKNEFRELTRQLTENLINQNLERPVQNKVQGKDHLFEDITDKEIDDLFTFAGT